MLVKDAIKHLKTYSPEEEIAFILWNRQDVIGTAKEEYETEITKAEADDILSSIHEHADCEYGITWETISVNTKEYIDNEKETGA